MSSEQTRRYAPHIIECEFPAVSTPNDPHVEDCPGCTVDALLAELEQAEREKKENMDALIETAKQADRLAARLASVPALVVALRTILNSAEDANQEYRRLDIALAARNALTVYEQSQGKP